MSKQQLMRQLFDEKILNVLDVFLKNKESQLFLREISQQSKVSLTSCYRIVRKLVKLKIVKELKVSRFEVYQYYDSEDNKFLEALIIEEQNYVDEFVRKIKDIPGILQIILHGIETKDRANILVIGNGVDADLFKPIVSDFKTNKKFTVSLLSLGPDQYAQMTDMGLYSGKKKVLYEKIDNIYY
jgi:Fe2+ or Zn2+ uptake regulation protein